MGGMNMQGALALTSALLVATVTSVSAITPDGSFIVEAQAAMGKMMNAMAIAPSGDVDADFAAEMIPHHQSAVDMAISELRYGQNAALRRIAQEIIVTQQDEIVAMKRALIRH
jgi:uncharacterized protein (DUF305 family)